MNYPVYGSVAPVGLARVVEEHQAAVRAYLARVLGSASEADDLAQEVFLLYLRNGCSEEIESLRGWLLGTARNLALEHLRAQARRHKHETGPIQMQLLQWRIDRLMLDPLEEHENEQQTSALRQCISVLPAGSRNLVQAHYFNGQAIVDIARKLNRADSTVRMMLLRTRKVLADCIRKRIAVGGQP